MVAQVERVEFVVLDDDNESLEWYICRGANETKYLEQAIADAKSRGPGHKVEKNTYYYTDDEIVWPPEDEEDEE
jgi:hypothetical protein